MSKSILIVDDDPSISRFIREALKIRGYEVHCAGSGEEALEFLANTSCHLLLLDLFLPGRSGLDICRELRQEPKTRDLPVIMMTAFYREVAQIREARDAFGATDYLLKPFSLTVLYQKVEAFIGHGTRGATPVKLRVEGSLIETPIPQLLHNHYVLRATGLLHLEREQVKKVIYLREGYPIFMRSNLVRECLGQMLIREGLLTAAECEESLQRSRESGRLQGTVLIEMGVLNPQELKAALIRQVTEKLLEIFAWPEGLYRFLQAKDFKKDITAIDLSPASLILEGIRRYYPARKIQEILLPHRSRYILQAENPLYRYQDLTLSTRDARILEGCRGTQTIDQILSRHPLARPETEQLLAALLLVGMVETRRTPALSQEVETVSGESAEGLQLRETLLADYSRMMPLNHFALLGVDPHTDQQELRKAYFQLVKKYHPDRFRQDDLSPDLGQKINDLFQRINAAYEELTDPVRRREYVKSIKGEKEEKPDVASVLQAETAFQKGQVLLRMRNYKEAFASFGWSVKLSPEEPEYLTFFAWSMYKAHPENTGYRQEAKSLLLKSIDLNPRIWTTHLYLGYICQAEGRNQEAERAFERTIQCNPDCTEALRELRLSTMRREKEQKEGGLLGRIFKK